MAEEIPVKEIAQLLDDVSNKLPKIIHGVMDSMFSVEAGQRLGKAVGSFYKELIEAGIPSEEALKMTKDYMFSIKDLTNIGKKAETSE